MLTVTKYDITDITNPQTIYKDRTCMNRAGNCCTVCIQLQNITGSKDKDILFRNTKIFYDMFLCSQMSVFTMNRNRIFWSYQRIDQFDFFLAGMSGYVNILENTFAPFMDSSLITLETAFSFPGIGFELKMIVSFG